MGMAFKYKTQCPKCSINGSDNHKDNLAVYDDGGKHCFACGYTVPSDNYRNSTEHETEVKKVTEKLTQAEFDKIKSETSMEVAYRGIRKEISKLYRVRYELSGQDATVVKQYVPVTKDGGLVGMKIRKHPKTFSCIGDCGQTTDLIGSSLFKTKGKFVVIAAGEIDMLSAYQMLMDYQDNKGNSEKYDYIPVVSPTTGEGSSGKQLQHNYTFLDKFDKIVLCFDNDEAGKAAVEKVAPLLPKGKVYIMDLRYKDANEYLTKGKGYEFVQDFWKMRKHTPAGIIASNSLYDEVVKRSLLERLPFPPFLNKLNKMLAGGITYGFIVNILAGSGTGKSALVNECVIHWAKTLNVLTGVVSLEADAAAYGENLLSRYIGNKLALVNDPQEKYRIVSSDETAKAARELFVRDDGDPRLYVLDDRGDFDELQSKVEELIVRFGVRVIVFDVISDVFAGMSIEQVDSYMKWQKNIVKQYNVIIVNVSHTRKASSNQKAASQGAFLNEESTIGSGTQYRSAGINLSLQRDKTAEDEVERNTTQVYLLKSRDTGVTGLACELFYENETHTLYDKEDYFTNIKRVTY